MQNIKPRILVTGASRGIGKAIFNRLLDKNFEVIGASSNPDLIPTEFKGIRWIIADLGSEEGLNKLLFELDQIGSLNGLINNAGINRIKPLSDISFQDFDDVHGINLKAPFFLCKKAAEKMPNGGHIVNIASIWASITKSQRSLYSSAKTGLTGLTRALAAELGGNNILVNAVSPGFTNTELTDASLTDDEKRVITQAIPLKRMAEVDEIARLVCFLVSSENTYITGQNILIDGGFSIV